MIQYLNETLNALYPPVWEGRIDYDVSKEGWGAVTFIPNNPDQMPDLDAVQSKYVEVCVRQETLASIVALEAMITPRRMREALTNEDGKVWLATKEAEIQALRDNLK